MATIRDKSYYCIVRFIWLLQNRYIMKRQCNNIQNGYIMEKMR